MHAFILNADETDLFHPEATEWIQIHQAHYCLAPDISKLLSEPGCEQMLLVRDTIFHWSGTFYYDVPQMPLWHIDGAALCCSRTGLCSRVVKHSSIIQTSHWGWLDKTHLST